MYMQQGIMGSHASPDLWISAEKKSQHTFCDIPPEKKKSAEILGKSIESAEVRHTKPEDEFRRTIGLNTKLRREFFSAEVRYTICVVEFRWKTKN